MTPAAVATHAQARSARTEVEAALDRARWPWSRRLSLWIDLLLTLEERAA